MKLELTVITQANGIFVKWTLGTELSESELIPYEPGESEGQAIARIMGDIALGFATAEMLS